MKALTLKEMNTIIDSIRSRKQCPACIEDRDRYYKVNDEVIQRPKSKLKHTCK